MNNPIPRIIQEKLDQMAARRPANQARGRQNHASGAATQNVFLWKLRALGVQMVEAVNTPWRIERVAGKIIGATPLEKVSGDFRGLLPGGRSVLVEVKSRPHLIFSSFAKHQVDALNQHLQLGGVSLIGWQWERCDGGHALMAWPVPGFGPRCGLTPERALSLNIQRIRL